VWLWGNSESDDENDDGAGDSAAPAEGLDGALLEGSLRLRRQQCVDFNCL